MLQYHSCHPDKMLTLPSVFSSVVIMRKYIISLWAVHSAGQCQQTGETLRWNSGNDSSACKGRLVQTTWPTPVWLHWRCWGALLAVQLYPRAAANRQNHSAAPGLGVGARTDVGSVILFIPACCKQGETIRKGKPFPPLQCPLFSYAVQKTHWQKASALSELLRKSQ